MTSGNFVSSDQTDDPAALNAWRETRRDTAPARSVRVQEVPLVPGR